MPIFDLYSKRKKRQLGDVPDVYVYDIIPNGLKIQIVHIWEDALGNPEKDHDNNNRMMPLYQELIEILRREYQVFKLSPQTFDRNDKQYAYPELREYFLATNDTDRVLDIIEMTFMAIDKITRDYEYLSRSESDKIANSAIDELNRRFKEHGIGYFYSDGIIGRIDSELTHEEIVKPALTILRQKGFENAQAEFLAAHEHYRQGKKPETLIECY